MIHKEKKILSTLVFIIWIIIFVNLLCFPIHSKTIYVDQSSSGDFSTINDGIAGSADGDVVMVRSGEYHEEVKFNKDIELIGAGPNFTKIISQTDGILFYYSTVGTISGFMIVAAQNGISFGNRIVTCDIRNCIISGCAYGIYYNRYDSSDYPTINIVNNTIVFNTNHAIYTQGYDANSHLNIIGNIIVNNGTGIYSDFDYIEFHYNNLFNNTVNYQEGFKANTSNISVDPKFVNQNSVKYVLANDSPCINAGDPNPERNDPDGTRNDIGAYGGPYIATSWPYSNTNCGPIIIEMSVTPPSVTKGSKLRVKATGRLY